MHFQGANPGPKFPGHTGIVIGEELDRDDPILVDFRHFSRNEPARRFAIRPGDIAKNIIEGHQRKSENKHAKHHDPKSQYGLSIMLILLHLYFLFAVGNT